MSYFVGAYASSPNVEGWDQALEKAYYDQLKTFKNMKGLEHPFVGQLHPHDDDWFLENIDPAWDIVFTCVPGTMARMAANPNFGIASDNEAGRLEAVAFIEKACKAVAKLNAFSGRQAVQAVEVQTAPNKSMAASSAKSLKTSLDTMLSWDWQGAQIVIEHCDQFVEGQTLAKGFLSLEDEIHVLTTLNSELNNESKALGMVINWGRSAIEKRNLNGAAEHIQKVKESGLLVGLMFSGASDQSSEYGIWEDTHMPPSIALADAKSEDCSLMTEAEMHRCLSLVYLKESGLKESSAKESDVKENGEKETSPSIVGIKLGIRPHDTSLEDRIAYNRDALAALDRFFV